MSIFDNVMIILCLIGASCFFSMSEIALAASRKIRLRQLADEGDGRAEKYCNCKLIQEAFLP